MNRSLMFSVCAVVSCAALTLPSIAYSQAQSSNPYTQGEWSGTNWPQTYQAGILETSVDVKVHTDCGALNLTGKACMARIISDVHLAAVDACTELSANATATATRSGNMNRVYRQRISKWIMQCSAKSYADAMHRIVIRPN